MIYVMIPIVSLFYADNFIEAMINAAYYITYINYGYLIYYVFLGMVGCLRFFEWNWWLWFSKLFQIVTITVCFLILQQSDCTSYYGLNDKFVVPILVAYTIIIYNELMGEIV